MEYTEEIKETLIKINDFIQANNDVNYKIRLLEREVPNLQELVKKLTIHDVVGRSEQFCECDGVQDLIAGTGECRKCGGQCTY